MKRFLSRKTITGTLISIIIGFVRVMASIMFVWDSKMLVDIATHKCDGDMTTYVWYMGCIMLVQIISGVAYSYWERINLLNTGNIIRHNVFSAALQSSWTGREEHLSGDITNRIQEDVNVINNLICSRIPLIAVTFYQLIVASVYLVTLAPKLLVILVIIMIVGVLGSRMFFWTIRKLTEKIRKLDSERQQYVQEKLQNRLVVLTLTGVERVISHFDDIQTDLKGQNIKRLNYHAVASTFMSFGFTAGYVSAFLWGVFGIRDGVVTYGMMTAFLQLVGQVQRPIAELVSHIPAIIHSLTSRDRLIEILSKNKDIPTDPTLLKKAPDIVIDSISYSYPGARQNVFDEFSCRFESGRLTVVSGPTGKGKSTLSKLIMGLIKPKVGNITYVPISNFMYVPQGNSMLSGTVRENLLLSSPNASEDDMKDALHIAEADFVYDLPEGLDTICGEVGSGLSEGQAQRISIARALLHPGCVLILDESTSALDKDTEEKFLKNLLESRYRAKTIIFISHREKILSFADAVIEL